VSGLWCLFGDETKYRTAYTYDRRIARRFVRRFGGRFFDLGPDPCRTLYGWTADGRKP
jgi:hypothetical protein